MKKTIISIFLFILTVVSLFLLLNFGDPQWNKYIYIYQSSKALSDQPEDFSCNICGNEFFKITNIEKKDGYERHWCKNGHLAHEIFLDNNKGFQFSRVRYEDGSGVQSIVFVGNEKNKRKMRYFMSHFDAMGDLFKIIYFHDGVQKIVLNKKYGIDKRREFKDEIAKYQIDIWSDWHGLELAE